MSDISRIENFIRIVEDFIKTAGTVKRQLEDIELKESRLEDRNKSLIIKASHLQAQDAKINRRHSDILQLKEGIDKESSLFDIHRKEIQKGRDDLEADRKTFQKASESLTDQINKLNKKKDTFKGLEAREIEVRDAKELIEKEKVVLREKKLFLDQRGLQLDKKAKKLQDVSVII